MRTKVIFDTKNCIQRDQWKAAGFDVVLLGDSKVSTL
jgi:UDP-N-acetyl-D-mannosaminuronic acid dehydrogenase